MNITEINTKPMSCIADEFLDSMEKRRMEQTESIIEERVWRRRPGSYSQRMPRPNWISHHRINIIKVCISEGVSHGSLKRWARKLSESAVKLRNYQQPKSKK